MDQLTIRSMTAADTVVVAAWMVQIPLWQRYGLQFDQARQQLEHGLANGDLLLAADLPSEAACGFAWCMLRGAFGRSPYLRLIGVRPGLQSGGVGAVLLAGVEHRIAGIADDLFLLVSDFNTAAQRFYSRHGYAQVGAIPGFVLPGVAEFIYRKRLKAG